MKKLLVLTAAVLLVGLTVGPASANQCTAEDAFCVDTNNGTAGSGNPLVDVTSQLPAQGIVAASPGSDPTADSYLFIDGDSTNQDPLDGYIGIHATDGPVFTDQGDFKRAGGNVLSPPGLPGTPGLPGAPAIPVPLPDLPIPLP